MDFPSSQRVAWSKLLGLVGLTLVIGGAIAYFATRDKVEPPAPQELTPPVPSTVIESPLPEAPPAPPRGSDTARVERIGRIVGQRAGSYSGNSLDGVDSLRSLFTPQAFADFRAVMAHESTQRSRNEIHLANVVSLSETTVNGSRASVKVTVSRDQRSNDIFMVTLRMEKKNDEWVITSFSL